MTNAELINELQTYIREIEDDPVNTLRLMWRAADALEAAEKRIAELEAQLPKEGEWMVYPLNDFIGRRTGNHRIVCKCGYGKTHYHNNKLPRFCENCGARMKDHADAD